MQNDYVPLLVQLSAYGFLILDPREHAVLSFVVNRTLRYKKQQEFIPYRHFLKGIYNDAGLVIPPVGLHKKQVIAKVESLCDKKYVKVRLKRLGNTRTNHFTIYPDRIMQDIEMQKLKLGKKYKQNNDIEDNWEREFMGVSEGTSGGCQTEPVVGVKGNQPISRQIIKRADYISNSERGETEISPHTDEIFSELKEARIRYKKNLQAKVDKLTDKPTATGVSAAWKLSYLKHYEGQSVVAPDYSDNAFSKFRAGYSSTRLPDGFTLADFIDWVVENWSTFPASKFTWISLKTYPKNPSFPYFAKMYKYYVRAYGELLERGVMKGKRIDLARENRETNKKNKNAKEETNALKARVEELEQKEKHLTNLLREKPTRTRKKRPAMKQVDELDFSSIELLPV